MDGNISFVIGTQLDDVITRDADEVPVAKILDYVSPAELERFENQDFFDEDERERLLPPPKPRGRPPKSGRIVPTFNIAPLGEETSREQSLLPDGSISIKKKVGRPKGWRKGGKSTTTDPSIPAEGRIGRLKDSFKQGPSGKKADRLTPLKHPFVSEASTVTKKARGRPRRQKNLSVVIPSFGGPQPQKLESFPDAESESDELLNNPKPQYSMITASGLGQSDTEDMTSRDQSIELVPASSSKKRSLNTSSAFVDLNSDINDDERSPHPAKRAKRLSETSPDPIADDSAALLRQFQATVYGPDVSAKSSIIPHRPSKSSPTLDERAALLRQFHAHTRSSSHGSSSSDSLMGPTPRPHKPSPTQFIPSNPLPREVSFQTNPIPGDHSVKVPASKLNNSITISKPSQPQPAKATPNKSTSSTTQRKVSLTPHFPPSTSFRHGPTNGSAESKPPSHLSSSSKHAPSQPTKTAFSKSTRTIPSPPKKRRPSPPPRSAPSQSSQASSTSKIGFAGIPQAKDITDYFAPKATTTAKTAPIQPPHSPTSQLLGDSESEDQLARKSSSFDSLGSEIIATPWNRDPHPPNAQAPPTTATAAEEVGRQQEPSHPQAFIDLDSTEDDESESEDEQQHDDTALVSTNAASSSASSTKVQSSADALNRAFEIEEDDEGEDSEEDSLGSEVMIVRAG